jgi:hypothetical protein
LLKKSLAQKEIDLILSLQCEITESKLQLQEIVDSQERELKKQEEAGNLPTNFSYHFHHPTITQSQIGTSNEMSNLFAKET